jgi:tetratricopeptide (TPR) repeat protein
MTFACPTKASKPDWVLGLGSTRKRCASDRLVSSFTPSPQRADQIGSSFPALPSLSEIESAYEIGMGAPKEEFKKPTAADSSATYLTLIQQYLAVFQFDNAVWLAERCVAEYPKSADAVYALAQCYYRSGQVRNARALLIRQLSQSVTPAMAFLAAQCCYDLGDYQGGEMILMKELRSAYEKSGEAGPIDEWIVQTTVGAALESFWGRVFSPCLCLIVNCTSPALYRTEPPGWRC